MSVLSITKTLLPTLHFCKMWQWETFLWITIQSKDSIPQHNSVPTVTFQIFFFIYRFMQLRTFTRSWDILTTRRANTKIQTEGGFADAIRRIWKSGITHSAMNFVFESTIYQQIECSQDWFVPSPALPIPKGGFGLNRDQIRETLNYFRKYKFTILLLFSMPINILVVKNRHNVA